MPSTASSTTTTTGAVRGSESRYISAEPYRNVTAYGIMVSSTATTKDERLEMRDAELDRWFSSLDDPFSSPMTRREARINNALCEARRIFPDECLSSPYEPFSAYTMRHGEWANVELAEARLAKWLALLDYFLFPGESPEARRATQAEWFSSLDFSLFLDDDMPYNTEPLSNDDTLNNQLVGGVELSWNGSTTLPT
ncbi:hypothetical protein V494_04269 [Pseudogymnoascus sp. VKM F-4513 (FW-928)]|nr:hypothetical protein V494_04269 [Pseudogymnoascus sp. VKM F-4513 (FW-928)]